MVFRQTDGIIPPGGVSGSGTRRPGPALEPAYSRRLSCTQVQSGLSPRRAGPEQLSADANHGGALAHGYLEVVGHPHRPLGEVETVGERTDRSERPTGRPIVTGLPHGHQATDVEPG